MSKLDSEICQFAFFFFPFEKCRECKPERQGSVPTLSRNTVVLNGIFWLVFGMVVIIIYYYGKCPKEDWDLIQLGPVQAHNKKQSLIQNVYSLS